MRFVKIWRKISTIFFIIVDGIFILTSNAFVNSTEREKEGEREKMNFHCIKKRSCHGTFIRISVYLMF